jgi:hypothetical protein
MQYQQILPSLVQIEAKPSSASGEARLGAGVIVNRSGAVLTALHVYTVAEAGGLDCRSSISFPTTSEAIVPTSARSSDGGESSRVAT